MQILKMSQNPQILEQSTHTIIVALSDTEIGKVILPNTFQFINVSTGKPVDFLGDSPTVESERVALQYANGINDLMPKFIRKQTWQAEDGKDYDMMVIERLYPLPFNHFDVPTRTVMMAHFERNLKELHDNHFVHGDLMRPTNFFTRDNKDWMFKNIIQTQSGLRLIDAGFGTICEKGNIELFVSILIRERKEMTYLKEFYLSY